jgi:hypothetical protein
MARSISREAIMNRHFAVSLCCAMLTVGSISLAGGTNQTAKPQLATAGAAHAQSNLDRNALNPQPLPPGPPDPERRSTAIARPPERFGIAQGITHARAASNQIRSDAGIAAPGITSVNGRGPEVYIQPGSKLVIEGTGFGKDKRGRVDLVDRSNRIGTLGGVRLALRVSSWSDTLIVATLPAAHLLRQLANPGIVSLEVTKARSRATMLNGADVPGDSNGYEAFDFEIGLPYRR